jgi:hypothetical protein
MRINDKNKKTVAFLQYQMADGSYRYAGTCFFIQKDSNEGDFKIPYAVTAKHVIEQVRRKGLQKIFIKLNLLNKTTTLIETNTEDWLLHEDENVDIAIIFVPFNPEVVDQYVILESTFLTAKIIEEQEIECGDEVVITGLFKHHSGTAINLPIVRIGNIAMMPGEKVKTTEHLMDAYLIESRSIGGLSGSPVFINYGSTRRIKGQVMLDKSLEVVNNLMGIVYGHYDAAMGEVDALDSASEEEKKINVGIAIVTPVSKLIEFFETVRFKEYEKEKIIENQRV